MPDQKEQRKVGSNIWIYISIGLAILLIIPEVDTNNTKPVYLAIQKYEHEKGQTYKIKARTDNMKALRLHTSEFDFSIYKDYIEYYIQTKEDGEFIPKLNLLLEEIRKTSTNIEFLKTKQFKEEFYVN